MARQPCSPRTRQRQRPRLRMLLLAAAAVVLPARAVNFTIANGQIYTPGFAIVDAPQPGSPEGGDYLQVALDVTADGRLPLPGQLTSDSPSQIYNITLFLYSYETQHNFTISNGTATAFNASLGPVLDQESGSTVKHVNWVWPACLAGDGSSSTGQDSARGVYNISIRQSFRLNNVDHYTIFDLPISVTNSIPSSSSSSSAPGGARPDCAALDNPLLTPGEINATAAAAAVGGVLFAPGSATSVDVKTGSDASGPGLGSSGAADGRSRVVCAVRWLTAVGAGLALLL